MDAPPPASLERIMKNPFPGKVLAREYDEDTYRLWCGECRPGTLSLSLTESQAKYMAHAINQHDELVKWLTIYEAQESSCPACGVSHGHDPDCEIAALVKEEKD